MNSTQGDTLRQLESTTTTFRNRIAKEHRQRWVYEKRRANEALDRWDPLGPEELVDPETGECIPNPSSTACVSEVMQDALSVAHWHEGRDNGQKYRFRKLASCGTRVIIAQCSACDQDAKPVPEGCGIARLCPRCALTHAKWRRARFGRARQRAAVEIARYGYTRVRRSHRKRAAAAPGGVWSDKMITLTVPHFLFAHVDEDAPIRTGFAKAPPSPTKPPKRLAKVPAKDATMARIYAVRFAWEHFARGLRAWFTRGGVDRKKRGVTLPRIGVPRADGSFAPPPMHRAFEWTLGGDGLGHPHLHVWTLAPFIPKTTIERLWRNALRAVGVPIAADAYIRVGVKRFRDFNRNAVGELLKAGTREALEWSRLYQHGPRNAFDYADGWTITAALETARPDVVASLYMALEGARLTQGSRGFFLEDEPAECKCCGAQHCWRVRFESAPDNETTSPSSAAQERAPP